MKIPSHHVISIIQVVYRRARRFIVAVLLIILIEQLWAHMQASSLASLRQHSHQLMQLTTQQAALSSQPLLMANEQEPLQRFVDQLLLHPFVAAASIHNHYGQRLVSTAANLSVSDTADGHTILVESIHDDQRRLGFLQVVIDDRQLLDSPNKTHVYLSYLGQFLLVFALLAGILIAITFNRWRYRLPNK